MDPSDQLELRGFDLNSARAKSFRGANGFDLSYWRLPKRKIRVKLSDGQLIDITKESPGRSGRARLYTKVPGHEGIVQGRNLWSFLAQLCLIDQIRQLNRSAQIKLKQSDDAARMLSDLKKDDAAAEQKEKAKLLAELQRVKAELEAAKMASAQAPKDVAREPRKAGQSINIRALQWALEQTGLSATAKSVLHILAIHSADRGRSWPGVECIASESGLDRGTVRRGIEELLAARRIRPTKERRGKTKQVKVFRLPKITWGRDAQCIPLKGDESEAKAVPKRCISGAPCTTNNGIMKKHQDHHDESITLGTSIPDAPSNASTSSSFFVEGHQKHQSQPARDHIKWPEYAAYCGSQNGKKGKDGRVHDGMPTEKGFWKWMCGQKPQWRNQRKQPDYIDGFVLDGKFLTREELNRMGAENPRLLDEGRFLPARKGRAGNVVIVSEPKR